MGCRIPIFEPNPQWLSLPLFETVHMNILSIGSSSVRSTWKEFKPDGWKQLLQRTGASVVLQDRAAAHIWALLSSYNSTTRAVLTSAAAAAHYGPVQREGDGMCSHLSCLFSKDKWTVEWTTFQTHHVLRHAVQGRYKSQQTSLSRPWKHRHQPVCNYSQQGIQRPFSILCYPLVSCPFLDGAAVEL